MPHIIADRVRETSTTAGSGSYALAGSVPNFRAFSSVCANSDTVHYAAVDANGAGWEVGVGTWSTGNTLARTTILASSNGGAAVDWSAGTRDIFITAPASFLASLTLSGVTQSASPFETSLGFEAGLNTTGASNTFIGYQTGKSNTTGANNAALGAYAGTSLTTGATNVLLGSAAGSGITTGSGNTGVGYAALGNTNQQRNTGIGYWTLAEATGADNTVLGYGAASAYAYGIGAFLSGSSNVGVGSYALGALRDGVVSAARNVAVGFEALGTAGSGARNVAVGAGSLTRGVGGSAVNGSDNVAVGDTAGDGVTTGNQNTFLGSGAGSSGTNDLTTGANNIIIGYNAAASSATVSNQITLGNASITNFRIPGLSVDWTSSTVPNVTTTATQTLTNKTISTGSTWSGTAIAVANGGTGATDAATARTNLGLGSAATMTGPAGTIVGTTDTQTLTNKRVNPRIGTVASAATITPTADTADQYNVTALAVAATIAAPSGTPVDGQRLILRFEDNGTGRALTWTTSSGAYRAVGTTLPTTTVAGKVTYVGCIYNAQDVFWDVVATVTQA